VVKGPDSTLRYEAFNPGAVLYGSTSAPEGIFDLGEDGVLRSYAGDGSIIDWRQFDPQQIKEFLDTYNSHDSKLLARSADPNTDGRAVRDIDQLLRPRNVSSSATSPSMDSTDGSGDVRCLDLLCMNNER
jgi:hypothetical protein